MLAAPARVLAVDVNGPFVDVPADRASTGVPYRTARVYVWRGDRPRGRVDLSLEGGIDAAEMARCVAEVEFGADHDGSDDGGHPTEPTTATVVIATRDRPTSLVACIDSILDSDGSLPEIVVVDSAPSDDRALSHLVDRYGDVAASIRYLRCARPGLAVAHNVGLDLVRTDTVLFTDDDVVVDRRWVRALGRALAETGAACATGLILPAELETETQCLIDAALGFDKGFERRMFNSREHRPPDPLFPFTAGAMGSGANMAFRTDHLRRAGGFDDCLGAGSPGRGGDDLAAFIEVIVRGAAVVYDPAAVVYHHHHRDPAALHRQARAYGIGMTAAVTSVVVRHPTAALGVVRRIPGAVRHVLSSSSPKNIRLPDTYPRSLRRRELVGLLTGPLVYARSRCAHGLRYRRPPTVGTPIVVADSDPGTKHR